MPKKLKDLAPLPLRLALGIGLIIHGGIKLFAEGGHENIAHLLAQLGAPFPDPLAWVVGLVEFLGGLGMLVGLFVPVASGLNALNVSGLLVLGFLAGGVPQPLPDGDALPEFREAFLILAGTLTLLVGGAGRYSLDSLKSTSHEPPD